jgi:hypothetical protein
VGSEAGRVEDRLKWCRSALGVCWRGCTGVDAVEEGRGGGELQERWEVVRAVRGAVVRA